MPLKTYMSEELRVTFLGAFGTLMSFSLAQFHVLVGIAAGLLTCAYLTYKIYDLHERRKQRKQDEQNLDDL